MDRRLTATQSSLPPPRSCHRQPRHRCRSPASRRARRSRARRGRGSASSCWRSGERNSSLKRIARRSQCHLTNEYSSMQLDERYHATSRLILKCDMPFRLPFSRNIQSTELPEMLPFDEISPLLNRSVPKIRIARTTAGTTATSP